MDRLPYIIAGLGLMLAAAPVSAQNLTLPSGSLALQASRDDDGLVAERAQPYALEQGRSAYEHDAAPRYHRRHR